MTNSINDSQQQLHLLDQQIEQRVQAIRASRDWWPCQRGCDHCCRQLARPPELTNAEWRRVDEAVAAFPKPIQVEINYKIKALLTQITQNRMESHVVCPFLDEQQKSCHIYYARPIACRTYGFFVARDGDDYCQIIEKDVALRRDINIIWGNGDAIRNELERSNGESIAFEEHYKHFVSD